MQNKRSIGTDREAMAAEYLEKKGYTILEKNYRCRVGEIDIVASKDNFCVFVEVKYRKSAAYGLPQEAVGVKKQRTIAFVANYYLMEKKFPSNQPVRFDVIAILGNEITHIENAFGM